jgi:hypothetical protein
MMAIDNATNDLMMLMSFPPLAITLRLLRLSKANIDGVRKLF